MQPNIRNIDKSLRDSFVKSLDDKLEAGLISKDDKHRMLVCFLKGIHKALGYSKNI